MNAKAQAPAPLQDYDVSGQAYFVRSTLAYEALWPLTSGVVLGVDGVVRGFISLQRRNQP